MFTAVLLLVMTVSGGEALQPQGMRDWSALIAYALIAQVFGWLVIGRVIPKLPAGVLGLCLLLQSLLSYAWDALLFGTRLGVVELAGLGLSLAPIGAYLAGKRKSFACFRSFAFVQCKLCCCRREVGTVWSTLLDWCFDLYRLFGLPTLHCKA